MQKSIILCSMLVLMFLTGGAYALVPDQKSNLTEKDQITIKNETPINVYIIIAVESNEGKDFRPHHGHKDGNLTQNSTEMRNSTDESPFHSSFDMNKTAPRFEKFTHKSDNHTNSS